MAEKTSRSVFQLQHGAPLDSRLEFHVLTIATLPVQKVRRGAKIGWALSKFIPLAVNAMNGIDEKLVHVGMALKST
jgi:hypothetical protein